MILASVGVGKLSGSVILKLADSRQQTLYAWFVCSGMLSLGVVSMLPESDGSQKCAIFRGVIDVSIVYVCLVSSLRR